MDEKYYGVGSYLDIEDSSNFLAYGEVYKDTVKALLEHFSKEPPSEPLFDLEDLDDGTYDAKTGMDVDAQMLPIHALGILPIIFLFRHYIELKLKGFILFKGGRIKAKSHDISELLKQLKTVSKTERISPETEEFIDELQKWDKNSDGFRYPIDTKGRPFFQGESTRFLEKINTLSSIRNLIFTVIRDLVNVEGDFDYERDNRGQQWY